MEPFVVARPAAPGSHSAGSWSETAATAAPSSELISMNAMTLPGGTSRRIRPSDNDVNAADYAAPSHGSGSTGNSAKVRRSPSTVAVVSHASPSTDSGSSSRNEKRGRRNRVRAAQGTAASQPSSSPDPTLVQSSASGSAGSSSAERHGSRPLPAPPVQRTHQRGAADENPEATARYRRKILDVMALTSQRDRSQNPSPPADPSVASPPPVSTDTQSTTTPVSGSPLSLPPRFQGGSSVVGSDLSTRTAPPPYGSSEVGRSQH